MESDKRKHPRVNIPSPIELEYPGHGTQNLLLRDMGHGGVFVEKGEDLMPPVGATVFIKIAGGLGDGEAPLVEAKVVRSTDDGIGLHFTQEDNNDQ